MTEIPFSFQCVVLEGGFAPKRAHPTDAGWDLFAAEQIEILPGHRGIVSLKIRVAIPPGYYGRIADRSSIAAKQGCHCIAGVVDAGYRGDVGVVMINLGNNTFAVSAGDKIAQLIITKIDDREMQIVSSVDELGVTERGEGGFGSTGK